MRQPVATYRDARGRLRIVEFSPSAILGGTDVRTFYQVPTWSRAQEARDVPGEPEYDGVGMAWRRKPVGA